MWAFFWRAIRWLSVLVALQHSKPFNRDVSHVFLAIDVTLRAIIGYK